MTQNEQIATTIIEQMGGFGKLRAMIKARNILATEKGVIFQFSGYRKANKCRVTLLPSDTYKFELLKYNRKTLDCPVVFEKEGLYWDMLKPVFEKKTGLYLSL